MCAANKCGCTGHQGHSLQYYTLEGDLKQTFTLVDQRVELMVGSEGEFCFTLTIGAKCLQLQVR